MSSLAELRSRKGCVAGVRKRLEGSGNHNKPKCEGYITEKQEDEEERTRCRTSRPSRVQSCCRPVACQLLNFTPATCGREASSELPDTAKGWPCSLVSQASRSLNPDLVYSFPAEHPPRPVPSRPVRHRPASPRPLPCVRVSFCGLRKRICTLKERILKQARKTARVIRLARRKVAHWLAGWLVAYFNEHGHGHEV